MRSAPARPAVPIATAPIAAALILTALILTAWPASAQDPWMALPDAAALPAPAAAGLAEIDGARMHWESFGPEDDATPVLLIHGGLAHGDVWGAQVADLMADNRVLVADTRGHGRSTNPGEVYSYPRLAEDYVALLDELGIEAVDVVGWSDGANIGFEMAETHPDRVHSLFAHAGNVTLDGIDPGVETDMVFGNYVSRMARDYAALSSTPDGFDAFLGGVGAMWATEEPGGMAALGGIAAPTLVVQSEHDEAIRSEHARAIADAIPGAGYLELPGVSHFALFQDPDGYTAAIRDWLAQVD